MENTVERETLERETIESELGVELPDNFETYHELTKAEMIEYLRQLDAIEKKAYTIGKHHLGTSFNVVKSNGFVKWKKEKAKKAKASAEANS